MFLMVILLQGRDGLGSLTAACYNTTIRKRQRMVQKNVQTAAEEDRTSRTLA